MNKLKIAVHVPLAAALRRGSAGIGDGYVELDDDSVASLSDDAKGILTTTWPEAERRAHQRTGEIFPGHVFLKDPPRRLEVAAETIGHVLAELGRLGAIARERREREAADKARAEAEAPVLEAEARAWIIEHGDKLPEGDDYAFHRAAREGRLVRASLTACLERKLTALIEEGCRSRGVGLVGLVGFVLVERQHHEPERAAEILAWLVERAYGDAVPRVDVPSREAYLLAAAIGAEVPELERASLLPGGVWTVSPISRLNLRPPHQRPQYRTGVRVTFAHPWLSWTLEQNRHELQWNILAEPPPTASELERDR